MDLFSTRPRIVNWLHMLWLAQPKTQTIDLELAMLAKYAQNLRVAAEIGSFQGVSAAVIARAMAADWPAQACMRWTSPAVAAAPRMAAVRPRWMG